MVNWYILWSIGIFYGHLVYFMAIFPVLVFCTKKNLATLDESCKKLCLRCAKIFCGKKVLRKEMLAKRVPMSNLK
jgi:hypothetical protein